MIQREQEFSSHTIYYRKPQAAHGTYTQHVKQRQIRSVTRSHKKVVEFECCNDSNGGENRLPE